MEYLLNFLPAFILFGSTLYFWSFTLLLFIGFIFSDVKEDGYIATYLLVGSIIITSMWSDFRILDYITLWNVSGYLIIGLLYSFLRTFLLGRKNKKEWDEEELLKYNEGNPAYKSGLLRELKEHVFRWWFLWWASIINWMLTDLISDLYSLIYNKLSNLFKKLYELGLK